mgnify:CR=1 FL=1
MADQLGPALAQPLFNRLTIIGLGLIGSSLARMAKHKGIAQSLIACDSSPSVLARVKELGIADEFPPGDGAAGCGLDVFRIVDVDQARFLQRLAHPVHVEAEHA